MITMSVTESGPLFDGRAMEILERYEIAAGDAIAQEGERRIKARLGEVLQHPHGYYVEHIATEQLGLQHRIHDSNVVYGSWLEGTSKRNNSTDFGGYHTFDLIEGALDQDAVEIAESVLPPYLAELNGGR